MPARATRPCRQPGCASLTNAATGYCENHKAPTGWENGTPRGTNKDRGYGSAWVKLRKVILQRDRQLCQVCLSEGKYTPAREVDHIVSKAKGGSDALGNLQAICTPCHQAKTIRERRG